MGTIIPLSHRSSSSYNDNLDLFRLPYVTCAICCSNCDNFSDNYNSITLSETTRIASIVKIQSRFRGYYIRSKMIENDLESKQWSNTFKEIDPSYSFNDFYTNPIIAQLMLLLPKKELTEEEKFILESQTILNKEIALVYNDHSYYKGNLNSNNLKHGYGILIRPKHSIYEGFFVDDKLEGKGLLYNMNGYAYSGMFSNGMFNGDGMLASIDGYLYKGNWKNNYQCGFGKEKYKDGSSFCGYFINGKKNGHGKYFWKNGDFYEGNFFNDEITGYGIMKRKNGNIYCGDLIKQKMEGVGIFMWTDKKRYIGNYKNDEKEGFGIYYMYDKRYEGFFKEGKHHGKGVLIKFNNGLNEKIYVEYYQGKTLHIINDDIEKERIDKTNEREKEKIDIERYLKTVQDLILDETSFSKTTLDSWKLCEGTFTSCPIVNSHFNLISNPNNTNNNCNSKKLLCIKHQ
jgi:hypothetical protein